MAAKKTVTKPKGRNWLAVRAHQRGGAGAHVDKKKKKDKYKCRGRVQLE